MDPYGNNVMNRMVLVWRSIIERLVGQEPNDFLNYFTNNNYENTA